MASCPPALLPPLAQSTAPLASIRRRRVRVVSGFEFWAVSLNAMYVRFRSGSVIAVPLHARISGVATVTDGDTLKIGPERIRLHGIDAPESAERCRAGGRTWVCGAAATRVLRSRIAGRPVECAERDRYGRIDAVCRVDGADVNAWMVAQGWTVAYRKYSTDYVSHEAAEKAARRGVWRGGIVEPSRWRCGERLKAAAAGGGGECRIKGKRPAERAEAPVHVADDDVSALVAGAECDADRVHFSARRAGARMPRRRGPVASCRGRSPSA